MLFYRKPPSELEKQLGVCFSNSILSEHIFWEIWYQDSNYYTKYNELAISLGSFTIEGALTEKIIKTITFILIKVTILLFFIRDLIEEYSLKGYLFNLQENKGYFLEEMLSSYTLIIGFIYIWNILQGILTAIYKVWNG